MRIENLKVKNYRSLENFELTDIPSFCVLVGANGTGKSTFFSIFEFLRDALKNDVTTAVQRRGGFDELLTRGAKTKTPQPTIEFEIQFRMELNGVERLVTYVLEIGEDPNNNSIVIEREILRYKRGRYGSPFRFLDFQKGKGFAIENEEEFDTDQSLETTEQQLDSPDILAIKGLGQFQRFKAASAFRQLIENWHLSDFKINNARHSPEIGFAEHLSTSGENLAQFALFIHERFPKAFQKVLETMKKRVPGVSSIDTAKTEDGRLILKFQDGVFKDPFIARWVSDGTIKMFAYLLLLNDPKPHPLLCIEEPENQLYPNLLGELAEEFAEYARKGGQVFVSTHSPEFLNEVPLESIICLKKINGITTPFKISESQLLINLINEGDKPGYLWRQGLFNGVDPS